MLEFSAWKRRRRGHRNLKSILHEALESRQLLSGGLTGLYYDNQDFTGTKFTRIDPTINFNWGTGSPMSGIAPDSFSVRWSGQVLAQKSETYTFYVRSDDGAKLVVNGKVLVDKMVAQAATEWSGTIDLVAGQMYDLHLDYFDRAGGASAQLSWSSPTTPRQIISSSQLDPNPRVIQQPPPPPGDQKPFKGAPFNVGDRIEAEDYDIGGEGISFHDVDAANRGGKYRSDAVDIEVSSAGGFDVAYATAGEWLEYTINVPSDGNYALDIATASYAFAGTFHIDVDGVAALGQITVPATGGWQKWQVLHAAGLKLTAGTHVLRLALDTNGPSGSFANIDYLRLSPAPAPGVDVMIRNRKEASYSGDNVYTSNGGVQQRSQSTNFFPATYELRIENDGTTADNFIVKSNWDPAPGWRVSYYEINPGVKGTPISLAGDGWNTGILNPGEFKRINVDVAPSPKAGGGGTRGMDITVWSASDAANSDTARTFTTLSSVRLPEIRRRNTASDDTYLVEVQNKGNVSDSFRITAPAGGTGFTLKYFDDFEAGNDITAVVTSGGWVTPKLGVNRVQDIRVRIIPTTAEAHTFTVTATSLGDAGKRDTVTILDQPPVVKQPPAFIIGAWSQPTSLFGRWKNRGINTLMHFEPEGGRVSIDQWTAAANTAGLYMIRKPRDNPSADLNEPRLLAWMHRDEPDIHLAKASELQADYDKWKAIAPNMPVLINFAGSDVLDWNGGTSEATYKSYLNATDWVSNSIYPVTGWYRPDDLDIPGRALDKVEKWSNGRPQFAIIESGPQNLSWMPKDTPGPNAGQFRFEMWDAVIRGAKGIVYFPFSFTPGFKFDNTPPEIDAEMRKQHPRLLEIGPALLSAIDPPSMGMRLPDGLEGTWRNYDGRKYFIVLNSTDQQLDNQQIRLRGVGTATSVTVASESRTVAITSSTISDSFGPYEAHVYIV